MNETTAPHDEYADAHLHRGLVEDTAIAEQGIDIVHHGDLIVLRGEVESEARRAAVAERVASRFPGRTVHNDIRVVSAHRPTEPEELS